MYAAFNTRDIDALLEQMTPDVASPNAWEGGRVHGHEEVRDYWSRQWSVIDPSVEPVAFNVRPDGRVAVEPAGARLRRSCAVGGTRRPRLHLPRRTDRQDGRRGVGHGFSVDPSTPRGFRREPRRSLGADAGTLSRSRDRESEGLQASVLSRPQGRPGNAYAARSPVEPGAASAGRREPTVQPEHAVGVRAGPGPIAVPRASQPQNASVRSNRSRSAAKWRSQACSSYTGVSAIV